LSSENVRLVMPTNVKIAGRGVPLPDGTEGTLRHVGTGAKSGSVWMLIEVEVPIGHVRTRDGEELRGHE
jgi:hypothetical protein